MRIYVNHIRYRSFTHHTLKRYICVESISKSEPIYSSCLQMQEGLAYQISFRFMLYLNPSRFCIKSIEKPDCYRKLLEDRCTVLTPFTSVVMQGIQKGYTEIINRNEEVEFTIDGYFLDRDNSYLNGVSMLLKISIKFLSS